MARSRSGRRLHRAPGGAGRLAFLLLFAGPTWSMASIDVVPDSGSLDLGSCRSRWRASDGSGSASRWSRSPGGRSTSRTWDVRLLTEGSSIDASVSTPARLRRAGRGSAAPYATVTGRHGGAVGRGGTLRGVSRCAPSPTNVVTRRRIRRQRRHVLRERGGVLRLPALPSIPFVVVLHGGRGHRAVPAGPHLRPQPRAAGGDSDSRRWEPDRGVPPPCPRCGRRRC